MDKLLQMMGLARRANLLLAGEEVVADAYKCAVDNNSTPGHSHNNIQ